MATKKKTVHVPGYHVPAHKRTIKVKVKPKGRKK